MTTTLSDLAKAESRSTKTLDAIKRAIDFWGEHAEAMIANGMPSYDVRSNAHQCAKLAVWSDYAIYTGAKRRMPGDGWRNVLVRLG